MLLGFNNSNINRLAQTAEFGIERESLRVTSDGKLAQTKHPFVGDPHIDRDFCENQVEMIGDVFNDPADLIRQLGGLLNEIDDELVKSNELLWTFSNPPKFDSEDEIPVARFHGAQRTISRKNTEKQKCCFQESILTFPLPRACCKPLFKRAALRYTPHLRMIFTCASQNA